MMGLRGVAAVAGMLVLLPLGALAAEKPNTVPKETCTARAPPPPEMAAWSSPSDLAAASSEAGLAKAALMPGKAINARLLPVSDVKYRVPPEKADGPQVFGGLYSLKITHAGTYRVAASAAPWMDLFQGKVPVTSVAHGHGPACTGLGKMVDFPLQPGDYLVQFSESLSPQTEIMVALLPK
jgi:hypothetical protein